MIFVYRQEASTGATQLADALNGLRWRGTRTPIERKARSGDVVISWGETVGQLVNGVKVLNKAPIQNKYQDALKLKEAGVSTIQVSLNRPVNVTAQPAVIGTDPAVAIYDAALLAANDFVDVDFTRNSQVYKDGVNQLIERLSSLRNALQTPVPAARAAVAAMNVGEWVARLRNHVGGNDLLNPPNTPEYYAKKETFTNEYRIHSFRGHSIRAGKKAPREGVQQHAWVRSWDGGWRILYDGVSAKQAQRNIAHEAVKALGLDFGAVDIGERADGTLVVLEVNRAPGIEGGTVEKYSEAIQKWIAGEW